MFKSSKAFHLKICPVAVVSVYCCIIPTSHFALIVLQLLWAFSVSLEMAYALTVFFLSCQNVTHRCLNLKPFYLPWIFINLISLYHKGF